MNLLDIGIISVEHNKLNCMRIMCILLQNTPNLLVCKHVSAKTRRLKYIGNAIMYIIFLMILKILN